MISAAVGANALVENAVTRKRSGRRVMNFRPEHSRLYRAEEEEVACPLNTASIAAWAHFSPSAPDTPIAPMTWPLTMMGSAPGCGKSCMKVGAKFSPLRTILLVSEVGRRQRKADFAFNGAVSIAFIGAPSMAWDSMRLPPQSRIAIATICLFCSAQAVQASAKARAPALDMTLISLVALTSLVACLAGTERACC